ncbi:efflux RND transporter permease subunit [Euryhalocaulis caribicus]|uniref:efflux RND transporter permease subunit n=1 Tax=Euryhalocaulis caribicus TaxID=1161401 RepID=UPI00039B122A|nr:efflux RND transporter permease subunit [Euryhalocaulis caribicus]
MISNIVSWSLKNRLFVLLGAAALLAWGVFETTRMPVDVFPDLTAPTVTVVAEAHGMAPEEVEKLITFPIETALNGASGVRRVRSSTTVGSAIVWVDFDWGTDIYQARQIVSEKLQLARSTLPPDIEPPVLAPVTSIMGEIMFIALKSDNHTTMEIKTAADWTVRRRLLAVTGVSQVIPIGGDTKQYQVILQPDRLAAYGLTIEDVVEAVEKTNENSSAGFVSKGGQEFLIRGVGRAETVEDIALTRVADNNGGPVLVRDVATVDIGPALKRGTGSHNGEPAVILGIQKQPGANTLELTERLDRVLEELEASLPGGMTIEKRIFRQADFISLSIDNLLEALRDGAILVVLIVFAFLWSARATGITLLAIPLSVVGALLAMKAMGATINTMTLGGLAIALGVLVDDAIIVVENIVRRLRGNRAKPHEEQEPAMTVVYAATREIQGSIVFATLIITLVFLPLFFLSGVEGRLLAPLGFAYIVALAVSFLVAITVTPALSSWLLPKSKLIERGEEPRVLNALKSGYEPVVRFAVSAWIPITAVSVALLAGALIWLSFAGRAFLPEFNEGSLTVSAVTLPGTSLEQSDALAGMVERILLEQPEVVSTARRTGRAELDEHAQGVNASEIDVALQMRERSKAAFLEDLRSELTAVPGMNIVIGQPISHRIDHMLSGTRANIAVKIFGPDLFTLRRLGAEVQSVMSGVEGVVDLSAEQQAEVPLISLDFDREAIARYGLTIQDVAEAAETAFAGHEVSRILEGQASFDLVVRYPHNAAETPERVGETLLTTHSGAEIPLSAVARVQREAGPNMINRENVQRKMVVMANVAGRDLLSVVNDIQDGIASSVAVPSGYHIEYGGQFQSASSASRSLSVLGALVIVGIFLLLYTAFSSVADALLVMLNLPLALIGGVVGVFVSGGVLSVASIIGFITLFGIATRNGVMMIAHIRHLIETGEESDFRKAVERGATERLIPILMTAISAGLALIPLALSAGEPGSEIQAPMAIVILFGLLTSTALNMVVVPALYYRFGAQKLRRQIEEAEPVTV